MVSVTDGFNFIIGIALGLFFIFIILGIILGLIASVQTFDLKPIWIFIKENIFIIIMILIILLASWNFVKAPIMEDI